LSKVANYNKGDSAKWSLAVSDHAAYFMCTVDNSYIGAGKFFPNNHSSIINEISLMGKRLDGQFQANIILGMSEELIS